MSEPTFMADQAVSPRRRSVVEFLHLGLMSEALQLCTDGFDAEDTSWLAGVTSEAMASPDLTYAGRCAALLAALQWGSSRYPSRPKPADSPLPITESDRFVTLHKLEHDIEQYSHLRRIGALGEDVDTIIAAHRAIFERLRESGVDPDARIPFEEVASEELDAVYKRIVNLRVSQRVQGSPLSTSWNGRDVEDAFLSRPPGLAVVDDFLSPEVLEELRRFCAESTVWFGNRYAHGRIGAFFHDGFNSPLLLQIAEELQRTMPRVVGRYPLRQLWGFKNRHVLPGDTTTHADFAAVNVNFWISPTEANLGGDSGGLVVYGVDAPPDWNFEMYNGRPDLIKPLLAQTGAQALEIPYRANRAIIFNSDLFHATSEINFDRAYENRRVNITMLYGERGDDTHFPVVINHGRRAAPAWRSSAFRRVRRAGR